MSSDPLEELRREAEKYEAVKQKVLNVVAPDSLELGNPQAIVDLGYRAIDAAIHWFRNPLVDLGKSTKGSVNQAVLVCALAMFAEGKGGVNPVGMKQRKARSFIEGIAAGKEVIVEGDASVEVARTWLASREKKPWWKLW